jgi:hypothetical protein
MASLIARYMSCVIVLLLRPPHRDHARVVVGDNQVLGHAAIPGRPPPLPPASY